jgi:predicted Zn-dependent peptidase
MDTHKLILGNGLRLIVVPMPWLRSVSIAVFVNVGSRYENERTAGISHLTEHMMFKGTRSRPKSTDITGELESVGGILNASTDKEITLYWAKAAAEHLPIAMDVISDMLRDSAIRPADVARERGVIAEELRMIADDPQDWVYVLADEALWPHHPYGREIAGSQETVSSFRRRHVLAHIERYYGPNNAVIAVAGGIDVRRVQDLVERHFSSWKPVRPIAPDPAPLFVGGGAWLLEEKTFEQLNVCLAFPGVQRDHPDRPVLEVLTTILGGGASSRLFEQLRERRGLAYDVGASAAHYRDTGSVIVSFGTEPLKGAEALECCMAEIDRLERRRVQDRELQKAKQFFSGRLWLGLEDTNAVAGWFGSQEMLQDRVIMPEEAIAAVDSVDADDIRRVARTYLRPDLMRVAAVGPIGMLTRHALRPTA